MPIIRPFQNSPFLSGRSGFNGASLFFFENLAREDGYRLIAGVDEAGRGPLAGPVVAAAVIIPQNTDLKGIRDSKKMSEAAREDAFHIISDRALATSVGVVSHRYIDHFDILKASLEAMRRAVMGLNPLPDFVLVDGIHKAPLSIPQRCVKKGDALCRSISAASILAKVYRDRIMCCYHQMYPLYGFERHKGYGTQAHLEALKRYGPSPVHRISFRGVS